MGKEAPHAEFNSTYRPMRRTTHSRAWIKNKPACHKPRVAPASYGNFDDADPNDREEAGALTYAPGSEPKTFVGIIYRARFHAPPCKRLGQALILSVE